MNRPLTNIEHLLDNVIMGDFNALDPLWKSDIRTDTRGNEIVDQISDSDLGVVDDPTPMTTALPT